MWLGRREDELAQHFGDDRSERGRGRPDGFRAAQSTPRTHGPGHEARRCRSERRALTLACAGARDAGGAAGPPDALLGEVF
eukprot:4148414-Pyramimonas_sp.AAC.1